ncbi:hypothetical protein HPP92_026410 [Vanilla planifolia]|uniref:Uncharacterized protein n=1 Tax=Vanilla planifolia TaxID=51239 RepID=A0A835PFM8_VANPL|nr:hypothetical protein HPP92_026410 [Vanilla planifolia]
MAADVTSLVRMMETYKEEADGNRRGLFTRDLLGEGDDDPTRSSKELDLDLQVPSGGSQSYTPRIARLNLPIAAQRIRRLDLKLSGGGGSRGEYQSVCTLEKVRSALERAGRVSVDQLRRQVDTTSVSPSASLPHR